LSPAAAGRRKAAAGVVVGALSLTAMDGLPVGHNLETATAPFGLFQQDIVVLLLIVVLLVLGGRRLMRDILDGPNSRWLALWAALLIAWWIYTLMRTYVNTEVPFRHAAFFGRDFFYFPVLTVLMSQVLRDRRIRDWALGAFALGTAVDAALQIVLAAGVNRVAPYVHPLALDSQGGIQRVYASSEDAVLVLFFLALGATVHARRAKYRGLAIGVLLFSAVAILFELVRAKYLGLAIAVPLSILLWLIPRRDRGETARRLVPLLFGLFALGIILGVAGPSVFGSLGAKVGHRLSSSITAAFAPSASGTSTLTRESELQGLLQVLGDHQILGLGFLNPRDVYFPQLRGGSIRNTDLGLFSVVTTMGVVGTVIYFVPYVAVGLALIVRNARGAFDGRDHWLGLAVLGWIITALAISPSFLFGVTGIVSVGIMLGCGAAVLDGERAPALASSAPAASLRSRASPREAIA
jgi:hypothetical protein